MGNYQGRTYQATLANGKNVVLTVAAGPSEIKRLKEQALSRHNSEVVGLMEPILRRQPNHDPAPRWWDVELKSYTEVVEYVVPGYWDCYTEIDQKLLHLECSCPALIPYRVSQIAPGWEVTEFQQGQPFEPDPNIF